jgi:transcriptional regulator of acetoin/glycerol metabolism
MPSLSPLRVFSPAAAPLFGVAGSLVGVLDLSGDYNPTRPHCAEVVRTTAYAIENKLLRELQDVVLVALSPHEQFLGAPTEGLLAFDPAGRLVAANGRARAFLGIADGGRIVADLAAVAEASRRQRLDLYKNVRVTPNDGRLFAPGSSATRVKFAEASAITRLPV